MLLLAMNVTQVFSWMLSITSVCLQLSLNQIIVLFTNQYLLVRLVIMDTIQILLVNVLKMASLSVKFMIKLPRGVLNVLEIITWVSILILKNKYVWLLIRFRDVNSTLLRINVNCVTPKTTWTFWVLVPLLLHSWTTIVV